MDLKQNTCRLGICYINQITSAGYSLRINAFRSWQRKYKMRSKYVARRLGLTKEEFERKLVNKEKFNRKELWELIKLMKARNALFVMYFPSFEFRRKVYYEVFGEELKVKKRIRRYRKNE